MPLAGADTIGVCLNYPERQVYYLHSLQNADISGTNATCAQVAVGVEAALSTLLLEQIEPRIYFASDLYHTVYRDVVFRSLRVEHFMFDRRLAISPGSNVVEEPISSSYRAAQELAGAWMKT